MIDPELLASFIAVAELRSFTLAAHRRGLRQSTVSLHIKRLEAALGRSLFFRSTHAVTLNEDGDTLLHVARQAVEANARIGEVFLPAPLHGRIRFGASEDFVISGLPEVLASFAQLHPLVDIMLHVGLSGVLYDKFDAGELDVIFVKRRAGDARGQLAWREQLVWIARPGFSPPAEAPLPLILYPSPSITRAMAFAALEAAGRAWHVACTSGSLSGLFAAAHAGLGVAPHSQRLIPPGLVALPEAPGFPALGEIEFTVIGPGRHNRVAQALMAVILAVSAAPAEAG